MTNDILYKYQSSPAIITPQPCQAQDSTRSPVSRHVTQSGFQAPAKHKSFPSQLILTLFTTPSEEWYFGSSLVPVCPLLLPPPLHRPPWAIWLVRPQVCSHYCYGYETPTWEASSVLILLCLNWSSPARPLLEILIDYRKESSIFVVKSN